MSDSVDCVVVGAAAVSVAVARRLATGCTGRPKLSCREPAADFRIGAAETHSGTGLVNLLGIQSPGPTAF